MTNDFCTPDGAKRLKMKIEEYWKNRGFDVNINLVDSGFVPAMRSARTDVRSNMVNGMPQARGHVVSAGRGSMENFGNQALFN
ncbi:MAG: hypothetical protein CME88_08260 [Hirschia sp.]|nr:hypothetical protein [Hirschia sp.]MBF18353.1 hypothetical protein [Hirschia sp.]|tara:strand:+ start:294 stop:542 length:249 start_codon:yes stop_codon:yes gene_type:complete